VTRVVCATLIIVHFGNNNISITGKKIGFDKTADGCEENPVLTLLLLTLFKANHL